MIDKRVADVATAIAGIQDGATVLVGGFGAVGQPNQLIDGLIEQGAKDLIIVANNSGTAQFGLAKLMALGRVRKIICSYPRSAGSVVFEELYRAGKIELELVPQGTLAERMRAAGAGIPAFFTPTAFGTKLADGKRTEQINGRGCKDSGRNFNPVMAMAGKLTIVQAQHFVELGTLAPDCVVTPGVYVDRVVEVKHDGPAG
jgi:3-oxoadipate CoA-transferase alpha subunit